MERVKLIILTAINSRVILLRDKSGSGLLKSKGLIKCAV